MWALPEEVRVRQAVREGISRAMGELYRKQDFEAFPDGMTALLARLETGMAPGWREEQMLWTPS